MVNGGFPYLLTNPILSFVPGFAIMLVVFAFNMVGDGLRDALDPRLRGTI
jgi:peptide/nickel transport system permease protein